jgi:Caspase domain
MANWAVVIGINQYWLPQACLKGAVKDALAMRTWLLDPNGGNVPPENLKLLLAPRKGERVGKIDWKPATSGGILTEIVDLIQRSGGQGERLYFFYAGHGITARVSNSDETTIVGTDFTNIITQNSCTLRSLTEFFETTQFQDQFFFIDACRNIPWRGEIVPGFWTQPQLRDPGLPPVQQFTFYATSPGSEARETADERGAFSKLLLKGLSGEGSAKAWAPDGDGYVVRWDRLVRYVGEEFDALKLPVIGEYQRPQEEVVRGASQQDPVLSSFPAGSFKEVRLTVRLEPGTVRSLAQVSVIDEYEPVEAVPKKRGTALQYTLPPKTYGVIAKADAHNDAKIRPPVDLYESREVTLQLEPIPRAPVPMGVGPPPPPPPAAPGDALTNGGGVSTAALAPPAGAVTVTCSDPLAPLELTDATGQVLAVGLSGGGGLHVPDLAPGFYRARSRSPEGAVAETVVEIAPGDPQVVRVAAPPVHYSAVMRAVLRRSKLRVAEDNTIDLPGVGPVACPRLSTILALAGGLAMRGDAVAAVSLVGPLGFRRVGNAGPAETALNVLFGVDSSSPAKAATLLRGVRLRLWRMGTPVPARQVELAPMPDVKGIGKLALRRRPGPHWLSLEVPGEQPLVLALALLPRRATMVVVERDSTGILTVLQYMPSLQTDPSSDLEQFRRLELVQRCLAAGRLDLGHDTAVELLEGKWADPIAGCLGGYLMLKLGKAQELETAARNMVGMYPELSDSHVLDAEFHAAQREAAAAERAAGAALDAGLPIVADGISRLLDYPGSFGLMNDNARLAAHVFDNRVKGALWSLWAPPKLTPRKLLVP